MKVRIVVDDEAVQSAVTRLVNARVSGNRWQKLYFTGTDPVHPDTIDIPCEVIEDKQLPENTETPRP